MEAGHYSMNEFAPPNYAMSPHHPGLESQHCQLTVRQQPKIGRVALGEDKNRKPLDPPPIVQLRIHRDADPEQSYLQSPYFFVSCNLVQPPGSHEPHPSGTSLAGTLVSSLHRLKDPENAEGAFFIFGDLAVKLEGLFALQFNLYEMRENECYHILSTLSDTFPVHGPKNFPGLSESTALTRSFSDQGVRLRVRKEPRSLLRKRGPASDNYVPRSYNRQRLQQEMSEEQVRDDDSPVSSRHSQPEQQASMQSPQQMGPGYSQQSVGSYPEEPSAKRPRTGSEQVPQQRFGQDSQQYAYTQHSHQMAYGHQRSQLVTPLLTPRPERSRSDSPDSDATLTDPNSQQSPSHYTIPPQQPQTFVSSYNTPGGGSSYFPQQGLTTSGGQQPEPSNFPPQEYSVYQQSQAQYYGQLSPQVMPGTYGNMGFPESSRRVAMGAAELATGRYPRTPSVSGYVPTIGLAGDGRTSYRMPAQAFTNQNLPAGMNPMVSSRSPSVQPPITTGPDSMNPAYQ